MKKFLTIAIMAAVVLAGCKKDDHEPEADILDKIPDAAFRSYIAAQTDWDTNKNGIISIEEIAAVTHIDVSRTYDNIGSIASLVGIEYFTALTFLNCEYNQLETLDVSYNIALEELDCYGNQLETLDVSNNTKLKVLSCSLNPLETLDVSNNTALTFLSCTNNQLKMLDISNNIVLTTLYCTRNQLETLNISNNTALGLLSCTNNQLKMLDISNNTALKYLWYHNNPGDGVSKFPVTVEFDNGSVPADFVTGSWTYNGTTITPELHQS